jgi:hypothetical protein
MARAIGRATMKWSGSLATCHAGTIGFTAITSAANTAGTTETAVMMVATTISITIAMMIIAATDNSL